MRLHQGFRSYPSLFYHPLRTGEKIIRIPGVESSPAHGVNNMPVRSGYQVQIARVQDLALHVVDTLIHPVELPLGRSQHVSTQGTSTIGHRSVL